MNSAKVAEDPRLAYLKLCKEENLLPKMGLIIGNEESNEINLANKGLTSKTVKAVADVINKYKIKVEVFNAEGNFLKDSDCKLLIESLQIHYKSLVSISFKGNKISNAGVTAFIDSSDKLKSLENLDFSENIISDEVAMRLMKKIESSCRKLKRLSLGRNFIGKSIYAIGMAEAFAGLMNSSIVR